MDKKHSASNDPNGAWAVSGSEIQNKQLSRRMNGKLRAICSQSNYSKMTNDFSRWTLLLLNASTQTDLLGTDSAS